MKQIFFLLVICIASFSNVYSQSKTTQLSVIVKNIPNANGQMVVSLHNSDKDFPKSPMIKLYGEIINGNSIVTFDNIDQGAYAVTVFHDENNNGKMDFNLFHIPKEDAAASNNAKGFMGPPKYDDAVILVDKLFMEHTIQLTNAHSSLK